MFKIKINPRFGDIDGLQHVNNNILGVWFESGRNDIFRMFTPDLSLNSENWKLILVHTEYDYLAQIYFDGEVEIRTYITKIGNSSFTIGHEAWQNNELKVKGQAVLVHFNFLEQKSMPIPSDIREKLEGHLINEKDIGKL